jgi:putative PIN family toxin of toxin-antitoxin system
VLKAVVDTNNFVSGLINKKGPSAQVIELWRRGHFTLFTSSSIIGEVQRVLTYPRLTRKYSLQEDDTEGFIQLLKHEAVVMETLPDVSVIDDDPDDNKFVACALKGRVDYIISGDRHLLSLKNFQNIPIVTAQEFLRLISAHGEEKR